MKILLAADGSEYTRRTLDYLAGHPVWTAAEHDYTAITVTPEVPPRSTAVLDHDLLAEYYRDEAEKVMAPVRAFFAQRSLRLAEATRVGHSGDEIAREADGGGYDLLMMGTHGHGTLGRLVMGSVSMRVLALCKTPILLIR